MTPYKSALKGLLFKVPKIPVGVLEETFAVAEKAILLARL